MTTTMTLIALYALFHVYPRRSYDEEVNYDTIPPEISEGYEEAIPPDYDFITLDDFIIKWMPWVTMAAFIVFSLIVICCIMCTINLIIKTRRNSAVVMEMREI